MLDVIFVEQIVRKCIEKHEAETGKPGMTKEDAIEFTMEAGGNLYDAKKVMVEGTIALMKQIPGIKELYE